MIHRCIKLEDFLRVERDIITKHIDNHMWFRKIADQNLAVADFIDSYGWLMRELYCGHSCEKRHDCELAQKFLGENDCAQEAG